VTPSYAGISYPRIEHEGIHWPCPTPEHPGTPILHGAQFTRGKGMFHAIDWIAPAELADDDYPMYLTTGRVLYHYHTGTMTMKTDGLNERAPESFVEIARGDAQGMGIEDGDQVTIASRRGKSGPGPDFQKSRGRHGFHSLSFCPGGGQQAYQCGA
jgi:predicted molibdopterin-dependent oxidoreductase YjgC